MVQVFFALTMCYLHLFVLLTTTLQVVLPDALSLFYLSFPFRRIAKPNFSVNVLETFELLNEIVYHEIPLLSHSCVYSKAQSTSFELVRVLLYGLMSYFGAF